MDYAEETSEAMSADASPTDTGTRHPVVARYASAYAVARVIIGLGNVVKIIAIALGVIFTLGAVILSPVGVFTFTSAGVDGAGNSVPVAGVDAPLFLGILAGVITGVFAGAITAIPIYIVGILIIALGQMLKTNVDTAVSTSPFLTEEEMRKVMSLD